jgi:hypothetical protein
MNLRYSCAIVPAFFTIGLLAAVACAAAPPASRPLPVHLWWSQVSMAGQVLDRVPEFNVTGLIIEHNTGSVGWGEILGGLCNYDFSDRFRREDAERADVEKLRNQYREILAKARRLGIDTYIMCPEVHVPKGFGPVNLDDPALWSLIGDRLQEVFRALPDLSGYMLYFTEGIHDIEFLPGSEKSKAARARKLLDTCWQACRAERRKMMVTTFIHSKEMLEALAEALRSFPPDPDFMVVQYCCPNDWGLYVLTNPSIGRVGPHPEVVGFDTCAENWGQGSHPFIQSEFMARRLREARRRSGNIVGLAGYVAWWTRSALGTLNEANVYTTQALLRSPDRDGREILDEWCAQRFGEKGARVAADCLARTQTAVFKAQHVYGYWVDTTSKSGLPTLQEIDEYLIKDVFGEALTKWNPDPELRRTWQGIQSPDDDFLARVLTEKDEAIRICRRSRDEIRANKALFKPEDFAALEKAFTFQELWAKVWRDRMLAFFLRQMGRNQGWPPDLGSRLEQVLTQELANADELERRYGADMFPASPARERQFVRDVRKEIRAAGR